ncbi:MAG: multiheme c-type cytochrome [Pseudomonadota bacterium]|nr:multiheme c-type cytochrome [Pseudomonadota bacterium]
MNDEGAPRAGASTERPRFARTLQERILWGASALLLVVCAVLIARRFAGPAPAPLPESAKAAALATIPLAVPQPPASDWLLAHFVAPLPAQGEPPADWTPIEGRLDAAACGACHVRQLEDWQSSWHAQGMGPGVVGQLLDGPEIADAATCQRCHAPLAEQLVAPDDDGTAAALRGDGLSCAGCHVRDHTRSGPPKADGTAPMEGAPHDGFVAQEAFGDARFCQSCHDFEAGQRTLEGKLLQETWAEWARTDYAQDGVSCQDCHMPEGRHLWKGVHDPDMVRSAFTATATWARAGEKLTASLEVTNTGAGHRFPTYTTPQITLRMEQLDAAGAPIAGTSREGAIARRVKPDLTEELFDTRLLPGERHVLAYDAPLSPLATAVRAVVECWPDEGYSRFYTIKLRDPDWAPNGRALIRTALERANASRFVAWEQTDPLP